MKKEIHPKYGDAVVTCACGAVWHIQSTRLQTCGIYVEDAGSNVTHGSF